MIRQYASIGLLAAGLCLAALPCRAITQLIKSGATDAIPVFITDTNGNPVTGQAVGNFTLTVRRPGSTSYVAALGTLLEIGNGEYDYTPTSLETTIAGSRNLINVHAVLTATATTFGDSAAQIVGFDPTSATNLGLTNLDAQVSTRSTYAGTDTAGTATLLTRIPGTVQPQTGDAYARLGTPAGATIAADIAGNLTGINGVNTKLGTPANGSLAADNAANAALINTLPANIFGTTAATYNSAGTFGQKINAAGAAGNPLTSDISTGYTGNQAGAVLYAIRSGQAVTLPAAAPTGFLTNEYAAIANTLLGITVDGTLTFKQIETINLAMQLEPARTYDSTLHRATSVWYRRKTDGTNTADTARPLVTKVSQYDSADKQILSATITFNQTNLTSP